jgi:pilus assembly protein CpaB
MGKGTRTLIVVVVAVLVAAAATFAVYRAVQTAPVKQVQLPTTSVVVAKRGLPAGTRLVRDDVKAVAWPADAVPPGGFTRVEDVIERGLMGPVVEHEPIVEAKLATKEAGAGLPPIIPDGMRAMSLKVNEVIGVAGFAVPGTRVDVIVTTRPGQGSESMSRVVLSNVPVLAAGTLYDQEKSKDGKAVPATVVTVLVSPADAERVALAAEQGTVMLALRNPLDTEPTVTSGIRLGGLLGTSSAVAPLPPPGPRRTVRREAAVAPPPPPPRVYTVETIRAAKRTEEVVR